MKNFPVRLRRLRENPRVRSLLQEHRLTRDKLIQPLFVKEGLLRRAPIASMPGQFQWPSNELAEEAKKLHSLGVPAVILFGIPEKKDETGKEALKSGGIIQKAVKVVKKACPDLLVITDVCLCEYLSHGHCGHVDKKTKRIHNDSSVKTLAKIALSHAESGADVVAPSDMMDGRVRAIRGLLDENGFQETPVLSYAVKYASAFYAPFREAAQSAPAFGSRETYQMNPASAAEALREAATDLAEGADMLLVKPALAYGDILRRIKEKYNCPVGAYSVSGEYAMIKAASERGWLDEKKTVLETHLSMTRAGADFLVTYWALELAKWIPR